MKIAVLGTGMVGQAHAGKMAELGHEVLVGTRNVQKTLSRSEPGRMTQAFAGWIKKHPDIKVVEFWEACKNSDLIVNALDGAAALQTLTDLSRYLDGKTIIDISNPLDFSTGELRLTVCNDDSLGEQIQKNLPEAKVVKAFNTVNADIQVNPIYVAGGDHHLFIAGNHKQAKFFVNEIAREWYGWKNVIDLGNITSARGMEMIMLLWFNLYQARGTTRFNFKVTQWDSAPVES